MIMWKKILFDSGFSAAITGYVIGAYQWGGAWSPVVVILYATLTAIVNSSSETK
jgi:hypothetical protein